MHESPSLRVLYEDNHLLAIDKPAGLPTMGVAADKPSVLEAAREYVKQKYEKPGNVYLGVVSRLDAPVTGVLLIARTSKAAARLTEQFRTRDVEKTYWAIVSGSPKPSAGELVDWLRKDERHRKMHVAAQDTPGAQQARLTYRVMSAKDGFSLVEVQLETGRKHQIRLQLAHYGHPVVGDRKYGSRDEFADGIALHARRLLLTHPVRRTPLELIAPLPPSWRKFGVREEEDSGRFA
jgi:23S rRNA pseudouridine1911/1915/1917 synthase